MFIIWGGLSEGCLLKDQDKLLKHLRHDDARKRQPMFTFADVPTAARTRFQCEAGFTVQ